MEDKYVWVDREYNHYTIEQISDRYLKNILRFICNGGGHLEYLDEDKITRLFAEAEVRKIQHRHKLKDAIQAYQDKCYRQELIYLENFYL